MAEGHERVGHEARGVGLPLSENFNSLASKSSVLLRFD